MISTNRLNGAVLQQGQSYALTCTLDVPFTFTGRRVVFCLSRDLSNGAVQDTVRKSTANNTLTLQNDVDGRLTIATFTISSNDLNNVIFDGPATKESYALWAIDDAQNPPWVDVVDTGTITIKRAFVRPI